MSLNVFRRRLTTAPAARSTKSRVKRLGGVLLLGALLSFPLAIVLGVSGAQAASCTAAGSGNWSTITWTGCASGPQAGDAVTISGAFTVTLNVDTPALSSVTI